MRKRYIEGRVSVIIPVYNLEKYIEQSIESALNQSYEDIEIVLVDDCSSDESPKIILNYVQKYAKIIYFRQLENFGAGVARNKCLEMATGQYVAFLDGDDIWLPKKTEKQIKLMKEYNCPFSYTAIEMIDESGKIIKGKRDVKEACDYKFLLHNTMIPTSSVIIDRNIIGDFRMSFRRGGQDYATWLKLMRNGVVARGINEALVKYRLNNNSLSSNKFKSIAQVWQIQTKEEKIPIFMAAINLCGFIFNAIKKYML